MEEILCRGKTRGQGQNSVECPLLLQWEEWTEEAYMRENY